MDYDISDVPKYRKKSKKSSPKKSNHEHEYEFCVFEYEGFSLSDTLGIQNVMEHSIGTYCRICGKIGDIQTRDSKWVSDSSVYNRGVAVGYKYNDDSLVQLNPETRTLPLFSIGNMWKVKYVNLEDAQ